MSLQNRLSQIVKVLFNANAPEKKVDKQYLSFEENEDFTSFTPGFKYDKSKDNKPKNKKNFETETDDLSKDILDIMKNPDDDRPKI